MSSDEEGKIPKRMSGEEKPSGPALPSGANEFHHHVIPTERCGALNVWVQGDLALARNEGKEQYPVFLVSDTGGMTIVSDDDDGCVSKWPTLERLATGVPSVVMSLERFLPLLFFSGSNF